MSGMPATAPRIHFAPIEPVKIDRRLYSSEQEKDIEFEFVTVEDGTKFYFNPKEPVGGGGSFGNVFLGTAVENHNDIVAIKLMYLSSSDREQELKKHGFYGHHAQDEEKALRKVGMLRGKAEDSQGRTILVMNYVPGFSPKQLVDAGYVSDEEGLKRLAKKTQKAIRAQLHQQGLTHNDVHQGNVRIDIVPKEPLSKRVLRALGSSSGHSRDASATVPLGLDQTLSTGSLSELPFPAAGNQEGKWKFKPRFIDYGMARDTKRMSEKEKKQACETDERRAYDALWLQRHRMQQGKTGLSGLQRQTITTGGLSMPSEKSRLEKLLRIFKSRDRSDTVD